MAYFEERGNSIRVCWRLGGGSGKPQSASFTGDDPAAVRLLAERARKFVEAKAHRVTRAEVLQEILDEPDPGLAGVPTLADWASAWLETRRPVNPDVPGADDIQPSTWREYVTLLELRILPYLGHKYLTELTEDVLRDWVSALKASRVRRSKANPAGKPISAMSVRNAHALLHQMLGAAVPRYLPHNPAARPAGSRKSRLGLPKVTPFEGMYLHPWEVTRIHERCSEHIADLWYVMVRTGLRLGEILVLRPCDVTVEGDTPEIRVTRALKADRAVGLPKSLKSRRAVTVSTEVARILAARAEGKKPRDLLFPSPEGKLWAKNNLNRRHWIHAVAEAMRCEEHPPPAPAPRRGQVRKLRPDEVSTCSCPGVLRRRPRMHDGRHTHASDCIVRLRMLPIEVQQRLGHASVVTTLTIYSHLWQGVERERLDQLDVGGDGLVVDGAADEEGIVGGDMAA